MEFKIGDVVERLHGKYNDMIAGDIGKVIAVTAGGVAVKGYGHGHSKSSLRVVNKENKYLLHCTSNPLGSVKFTSNELDLKERVGKLIDESIYEVGEYELYSVTQIPFKQIITTIIELGDKDAM